MMMRRMIWILWAILPVVAIAWHYGPGQDFVARDAAAALLQDARSLESDAQELQDAAYALHLETMDARKATLLAGADEEASVAAMAQLEAAAERERAKYAEASEAWRVTAERYEEAELLLPDGIDAERTRWAKARAMVRGGSIWGGIDQLQALLDQFDQETRLDTDLARAVREEYAAAHYYGARILREEGKPDEVWRPVSTVARQQFRYLAENAVRTDAVDDADRLQKNLERVLNLEQLDPANLFAAPLPRESPRGRRPGDGPGRPGRGPNRGDRPGNGAGPLMEIGRGW